MLSPYDMSSVIITGPKDIQEDIIKELHTLKVLHIVEHSKNEQADIGNPLEGASSISEMLVKSRALIAALNIKRDYKIIEFKKRPIDIEPTIRKINDELNSYLEELKRADSQLLKNESIKQELEILNNINIPLENITSYKSLICFTGYVQNEDNIADIKVELSVITKNFMLLKSPANKRRFIVLFVDAKTNNSAELILKRNRFIPVNFASIPNLRGTAAQNLKKIENEIQSLKRIKDETKRKIERLSQQNLDFLIATENLLSEQLEKAEAPLKFAATASSFLIKGWVPSEDLHKSIDRLNKAGRGNIYIQFEPAKNKDKVPVKLKNPKLAKSFEFFLDLYSTPTYKEIDPTFFVFLTFPIFFGIMLGDIGYGLTSLAFFWLMKKKMPKAKNFFNILMIASFATIIFGLLFAEFFGFEIYHPAISREHEMFTLLYMVLAIGAVHVNIGLIVGFVNIYRAHGLIMAIYEKASWIVLELGVALLALSYLKITSISPFAGAAFLGASILMIFKGEGVKGLMELSGIFTNILSYSRLMAIGLSSVILAVIINESAAEFFHQGGLFVLIGILILIIGHIINIMLGLLGSFLHSLRLHYVEFFSKFFHGGAKKYQPFGAREY